MIKQNFICARKSMKKNWDLYLLIAPIIVYFIIFHYWPMYGIQIAFKDFSPALGINASRWVGTMHFKRFFNGFYVWRILKNTIGISAYGIIIGIPTPIILALMFNELRNKKFKTVLQTISYTPHFLSTVVAVSILLMFLSPERGIINKVITLCGGDTINFIGEPSYFWHIYVWSGVWQGIGWGSIIYSAAISGIPGAQYEAAIIDGANKFDRIRYVTIPNIMPTIVIISIMSIGNIMSIGFEKVYLLQNNLNIETSEIIATYVYKCGIQGAQFSFSAAVGLFNNVVNFIILAMVNSIARKVGETSLW